MSLFFFYVLKLAQLSEILKKKFFQFKETRKKIFIKIKSKQKFHLSTKFLIHDHFHPKLESRFNF